jgi:hypothetical protein
LPLLGLGFAHLGRPDRGGGAVVLAKVPDITYALQAIRRGRMGAEPLISHLCDDGGAALIV